MPPWRRVDLNRPLPPFPHQGSGITPPFGPPLTADPHGRFDDGGPVQAQFQAAQAARQQLADDIYRRLLAAVVMPPVRTTALHGPANPSEEDLRPRRWLAQLAANIVDFIDEDDLSTPFHFYDRDKDAGGSAEFNPGALTDDNPELPRYWVFGTELPHVLLNEVLAEHQLQSGSSVQVRVWAELANPFPAVLPPTVQQADRQPVPLFVAGSAGRPGYAPYRVVIAGTNLTPDGPLLPRPGGNDNVLGTPADVRTGTGDADFATPVGFVDPDRRPARARVAPERYFLLGPPGTDAHDTIATPRVPGKTPWLRSPAMQYAIPYSLWARQERRGGITVLLRRLANPHWPFDPRPALDGRPNPAFNPYVTIDYLERLPVRNANAPVYASRGKWQPYAADFSQVADQLPVTGSATRHTFGRRNDPAPPHYDWLVHLDRQLISPMELLHVSAYPPHQLTHRFITGDVGLVRRFKHLAPWFDQARRLYRAFEFLETHDRTAGSVVGGRLAGRVNLNTVWDQETFQALCDPQPANHFTLQDVNQIFARLTELRTPGGVPGPDDRPFLSLATGYSDGDLQSPEGLGINRTLLRDDGMPGDRRLFQVPFDDPNADANHPFLKYELLTKIFNRITTRSHVFAVWLTVGFFEVTDDSTRPVKLGAEIGRREGRHVRHRMFAIVDRSNLTLSAGAAFVMDSRTAVPAPGAATAAVPALSGASRGAAWEIRAGSQLVVDTGPDQEVITVTGVQPTGRPPSFRAMFHKRHAAGFRITNMGNPGPQERFDPRLHPALVPYFSIID